MKYLSSPFFLVSPLFLAAPAALAAGALGGCGSSGDAGQTNEGGLPDASPPGIDAGLPEAAASGDAGSSAPEGGGGLLDAPASVLDAPADAPAPDAHVCTPSCGGAACGDDGCGGSCGACSGNDWCGGGGTPGQCGSSMAIPPYPGVAPIQVDTGAALGLRVARDEKHVLVQRTEVTQGTNAFEQGALAVVTVASSGAGSAAELTTAVRWVNGTPQADFSADSAGLFFVDVAPTPNRLVVAAADGSSAHAVATGIIQSAVIAGQTLVYVLDPSDGSGNREVWAVTVPSGTPVRLVAAGTVNYPVVTPSPSGSSVIVGAESSTAYQLIQTASGAAAPVGSAGASVTGWAFSPDGARFAYWIAQASGVRELHVVKSDGTGDQVLTASNVADPVFSGDGQRVAFGVAASGSTKLGAVTVHDFGGAADVTVTASTSRTWEALAFSPDGQALVLTSLENTLAAAPAAKAGAFVELSASVSQSQPSAPPLALCAVAGGDAAVLASSRAVTVGPIAGGGSHALAVPVDDLPFYEPVATSPRLLAFTSTSTSQSGIPGSVVVFPFDGSGAGAKLPGAVLPAFTLSQLWNSLPHGWQGPDSGAGQVAEPFTWGWLGSEIVYETDRTNNGGLDVVAATDDLGTVGVIAPGARVWAVRDAATPTRTFFTRPAQNGVWSSAVPQTPGR